MLSEVTENDRTQVDDNMTAEERKDRAQGILWGLRLGHTGWMGQKKEYVNLMQVDRVNQHDWSVDICLWLLHILAHGGGKDGWVSMSVRKWIQDSDMTEEDLAGARESLREEGLITEREPKTGKKIEMRLNLVTLDEVIEEYWAQWR